MKRDPNTHELVSITVRLGCELKRERRTCAERLELSENDIAKHAIRGAVNFIKAMDYRLGPLFKVTLNEPPVEEPPETGVGAGVRLGVGVAALIFFARDFLGALYL
jgi:hypothetical protein